jgi:hypothetical protein
MFLPTAAPFMAVLPLDPVDFGASLTGSFAALRCHMRQDRHAHSRF